MNVFTHSIAFIHTMVAAYVVASPAPLPSTPAPSPSPSAVPSPPVAPTASPSPLGFSIAVNGSETFVGRTTSGPGQTPPEGAMFAAGEPIAPISPFDWFGTAPLLPGASGQLQYQFVGTYRGPSVVADASFVVAALGGDVTNGIYWAEPFVGQIDPHEGRSWLPYAIRYPTRADTNDTTSAEVVSPYFLSLHASDERWRVTAGYVAPAQYDAFVFTPPALTSVSPSMNLQTFESVGPALADLDSWNHIASTLPLLGADAQGKLGPLALEATDALLPSPAGTSARLVGGSAALDRGGAGRFSFGIVRVATNGAPLEVPTLFGARPTLHPGPQGDLSTSTLADQRETIAGARAFLHPYRGYDALLEVGRSWYDAGLVARPGTSTPGDYQHYGLTRTFGDTDALGVEYYRMDPRYATAVLPYGIAENVWGTAWAFPGPWLKGTYQLVNDAFGGSNRVGFRVHGDLTRGRLETHAAAYSYRQLLPSTYANLTQAGFVEVDYLPLQAGDVSLGHTRGIDGYAAYHFDRDTISIDYAHDLQARAFAGGARGDLVAMRYPQFVIAEQHHVTKSFIATGGYGRYETEGTWSTTPVASTYALGFAGAQYDFGNGQQLSIQVREFGLAGYPSIPGGPPPTLRGTSFVIDHHIAL